VGAYIYRLHLSIDHALAVSYRRDQFGENVAFVARITLVKGIPFYGFHVGYRFFLKIYMYNPMVMTRLADLLQQGVVMKQKFQPYEAHIQYLLQFMIDYNLYGCDYLDSSVVNFRAPIPLYDTGSNSEHIWHDMSITTDLVTNDISLPRVSHCSIEVDICVHNIMNRHMVKERRLHHDFIERDQPLASDLKYVYSMAGLWKDETKRRLRQMPAAKQGSSPFPPEVLVTMSADPRQSEAMGWIHEEEYRDQILELVAAEQVTEERSSPDFESYIKPSPYEESINSILQSVEDLYPSNLLPALGFSDEPAHVLDPTSSIEVDETKVLRRGDEMNEFFPEDSDEEALRELGKIESLVDAGAANEPGVSQTRPRISSAPDEEWISSSGTLNIAGICTSSLKTGKLARIPISPGILSIADKEGLVSRAEIPGTSTPASTHKRKGSSQSTTRPIKRVREYGSSPGFSSGFESTPSRNLQEKSRLKGADTRPLRSSPLSSSKSAASQTLPFTIVKDQNDPNTKLRLSQRSQEASEPSRDDNAQAFEEFSLSSSMMDAISSQSPQPTPSLSRFETPNRLLSTHDAFELSPVSSDATRTYLFSIPPPSTTDQQSMAEYKVPDAIYQDAFYSKEKDVPLRAREYAGQEFRLYGNTLPFLPDFDATGHLIVTYGSRNDSMRRDGRNLPDYKKQQRDCSWKSWEYIEPAPSYEDVENWWMDRQYKESQRRSDSIGHHSFTPQRRLLSQIDGPTPRNKHGFKYSQKAKSTSVEHEVQYMSTMSVEVHVNTRGNFVPNPEEDEVQCIFWAVKSDDASLGSQDDAVALISGVVVLSADGISSQHMRRLGLGEVVSESSELDALVRIVEIVRTYDPDILTGYEVHGGSWGYLMERARLKYDYNLCEELSRVKSSSHGRFGKDSDRWGFNTTSSIRVTGRHMINIWRAMRGELNLLQYTMENVVWHLLHRRIPHYAWKTLTDWYQGSKFRDIRQVLRYYQLRTRLDIEILEANELISRTSEQARLLGVDFFSVFSRGSQFKVESIMFRIAKPENFVLVSPSKRQVGGQNALECLPLVMEPQSAFYTSPLLVLDFQSLYPSVMIAYNYCYSTFLGRISNWRGASKMGFTEYKRQQGLLSLLKDYINIAPNGMMYAKQEIRKSLLAKMLTEILETRVMVKSGMKKDKDDKTLQQLLNNRQLALKLLANVTYGYTSASFSGRMPCAEIADSIVQTGRETLEKAVAYIHSVEKWGAEVVYGDTDSLFVYLKGKTRAQAFDIGDEIAKAITDMNPRPVKLKFEKVYHPCVLLAKKRYVGYKYENRDQTKPEFDAKGIETVRRDGTPAEQMIEEKALRLLFETADLSQIKEYFQRQCKKIMRGTVSIQDFCFAKEVRLGTYSDKGPPPAGALISTRRMLQDARAEPQYGERVPYVVITGAPGARLIDRCVAPEDLLSNPHWRLDAEYYISKNLIPPLERIFNLVGASVRQWYDEVPKVRHVHRYAFANDASRKRTTLEAYMQSTRCVVCAVRFKRRTNRWGNNDFSKSLCSRCRKKSSTSLLTLQTRVTREERQYEQVVSVCRSCSGLSPLEEVLCDSKDCPVFWTRTKQLGKTRGERSATQPVIDGLLQRAGRSALAW
jgi:DNA polymerase zeta